LKESITELLRLCYPETYQYLHTTYGKGGRITDSALQRKVLGLEDSVGGKVNYDGNCFKEDEHEEAILSFITHIIGESVKL